MWDGAHGVVGYAGGVGAADPGGVGEEGVEAPVAALGWGFGSVFFWKV